MRNYIGVWNVKKNGSILACGHIEMQVAKAVAIATTKMALKNSLVPNSEGTWSVAIEAKDSKRLSLVDCGLMGK